MTNRDALKKAYQVLAPYSDKQKWEFNSNLIQLNFLIKYLPKKGKILDVGSYIGILALALKFLDYDIEAADKYLFLPSNGFFVSDIDNLKKIWDKYHFRVSSKDFLTDDMGKKFDAIISAAVIEHQRYPKIFIENLVKNLNSGGLLYIATPNVNNLMNRFRVFFGRAPMANISDFYLDGHEFNGHWREYNLQELITMFNLSNIDIVASKTCQSIKPDWTKRKKFLLNITRVFASFVPSLGDANLIIGRIK